MQEKKGSCMLTTCILRAWKNEIFDVNWKTGKVRGSAGRDTFVNQTTPLVKVVNQGSSGGEVAEWPGTVTSLSSYTMGTGLFPRG
jgi:hypothetical protein